MAALNATICSLVTVRLHEGAYLTVVLLKISDQCSLQVTEMEPAMIEIGDNLEQALNMQASHAALLKKLAESQCYLEQLLCHSDDIAFEQDYGAVDRDGDLYEAISENLEEAWNELVSFLQIRTMILQEVTQFHERYELALKRITRHRSSARDISEEVARRRRSRIEQVVVETLGLGEAIIYRLIKIGSQSDNLDDMKRALDASCKIEAMMLSLLEKWNSVSKELSDFSDNQLPEHPRIAEPNQITDDYTTTVDPVRDDGVSLEQHNRDVAIIRLFEMEFAEAWNGLKALHDNPSHHACSDQDVSPTAVVETEDSLPGMLSESSIQDSLSFVDSEYDADRNDGYLATLEGDIAVVVAEAFTELRIQSGGPVESAEFVVRSDNTSGPKKNQPCLKASPNDIYPSQRTPEAKRSQAELEIRSTEFYFISLIVLLFMMLTLFFISTIALFGEDFFRLDRY